MPHKAKQHTPPAPRVDRREPGHNAHYKTAHWQRLRAVKLAADPVCEDCRRESAAHVDHVVALEKGGTDDMTNLRSLCHRCHSRKTVAEDCGFGRGRAERAVDRAAMDRETR